MSLKVASFFSGIGGFDLGFERAGMEVVFQCENNKFCQQVLRQHWPGVTLYSNIEKVVTSAIPEAELWCAGFPCQDLSLANQGKRTGLKGNRSGLFYEFRRLLQEQNSKPRWIVLENVPGLLNSRQGQDFQAILTQMDELGYCLSWRVLDAKYFGVPQRRRRLFIVGSYRSPGAIKVLFGEGTPAIDPDARRRQRQAATTRDGSGNQGTNLYVIQHASIGRRPSAGPQAKGYRNDGETWTLDSRGSADVLCATTHPFRVRETSGVSSGVDSRRYRSVGNAVAVPVIEWIGKRILRVEQEGAGESIPRLKAKVH